MHIYIYNTELLCEDCGKSQISLVKSAGIADNGDSNAYPQGPFPNGGGEADFPQTCAVCGILLENQLTSDGERAVMNMKVVPPEWSDYYSYLWEDNNPE